MPRVSRFDAGQLAKPERTAEGFLRVEGVLARTCILHYLNHDGTVRHELVDETALFDPASVRSFAALALTNNHPTELLTPATVGTYQIGSVGEPRRDGDRLVSMLGVLRADAVTAVEGGKVELSCGYTADLDETPGTHPKLTCPECGTNKYDASQRDRRGNHVAICNAARAGHEARIRLDSAGNAVPLVANDDTCVVASLHLPGTSENPTMPTTLRFDALSISSDAADLQAVLDRHLATVKLDAASALTVEKTRADAAVKDVSSIKTKFDAWIVNSARNWKRVQDRLDAMMKRMVTCDECGGAKQIDGTKCPSCDGMGSHSARDAIQSMPMAEGESAPDDDVAEMEDGLAQEPAAEEAMEKKANPEHADAAKKRAEARKVAQKRRADMFGRIADRRGKVRAALLAVAANHLDAADLDKPNVEIKRSVLVKVATHLDAAKMDAADVERFYEAEMKRLDTAADTAPSASDTLRAGVIPRAVPVVRVDSDDTKRAKLAAERADAWKPKFDKAAK